MLPLGQPAHHCVVLDRQHIVGSYQRFPHGEFALGQQQCPDIGQHHLHASARGHTLPHRDGDLGGRHRIDAGAEHRMTGGIGRTVHTALTFHGYMRQRKKRGSDMFIPQIRSRHRNGVGGTRLTSERCWREHPGPIVTQDAQAAG